MSLPYVCPICRHYGLEREELAYYSYICPACSRRYRKAYYSQIENSSFFIEELTNKEYAIEIFVIPEEED
jgi:transposase-like protein